MYHGTVLGDVNKKLVPPNSPVIHCQQRYSQASSPNFGMADCSYFSCFILVAINLLEEVVEILSNDPEEAIFPLIDFSGIVYN